MLSATNGGAACVGAVGAGFKPARSKRATLALLACWATAGSAVALEPLGQQTPAPGQLAFSLKAHAVIIGLREPDPQAAWREKISARTARHQATLERLQRRYVLRAARPAIPALHDALRGGSPDLSAAEWSAAAAARFPRRAARAPVQADAVDLLPLYVLEPATAVEGDDLEVLCRTLRSDPAVLFAEPDSVVEILGRDPDPFFRLQWALDNAGQHHPIPDGGMAKGRPDSDVDAPEAWGVARSDTQVVVAIVDTGVDAAHADLIGRLWEEPGGGHGHDFWNGDDDPADDNGHGTHCAGIVAAARGNGVGVAGVCPQAAIMAVKVFNENGASVLSVTIEGLFYATVNGAEVLSNSWGTGLNSESLQLVVDYAWTQGAIVVAAAGNGATDVPAYPAGSDHVLAVAATDARDRRARFSNFGSWVDLAAPGVDVLSLRAAGTDVYALFGEPDIHVFAEEYYLASGTSMACPHVSAAAALLCAELPERSAAEIAERLLLTADDLGPQNPGYEGSLGSGRLNLHQALTMAAQPRLRLTGLHVEETRGDGNAIAERGEMVAIAAELTCSGVAAGGLSVRLFSTDGQAEVLDGVVEIGDLSAGQSASALWPVFIHDDAQRSLNFELELRLAGTLVERKPLGFELSWPLHDGWPRAIAAGRDVQVQAVAADLDGDGRQEIVATDGQAQVEVRGLDGRPLRGWPAPIPQVHQLAIGNLDADAGLEIVVSAGAGLYALDADGSQMPGWPVAISGADIVLADLDATGSDEVISVTEHGVQVFTATAAPFGLSWPPSLGGAPYGAAVADLDADGANEVLVAADGPALHGTSIHLFKFDGQAWGANWPVTIAHDGPVDIVAGDLSGDLAPEIVVATRDQVYVFDRDGAPAGSQWPATVPGSPRITNAVLGDVSGDGRLDVLLAGKSRTVHALDGDAQVLPGWPVVVEGPYSFLDPYDNRLQAAGDLDGDGAIEIVVGALTGVHLFSADGSYLFGESPLADAVTAAPAAHAAAASLADLDADGRVDLLAGAGGQIFIYSFDGAGADVQWAGDRSTPGRSGSAPQGAVRSGRVDFDAASYRPDDLARVTVRGPGLNADSRRRELVAVELTSLAEAQPEVLDLLETAPASGVFTAEVPLAPGQPIPDGIVQVAPEDLLTARSYDAVQRQWRVATAVIDGRGPVIVEGSLQVAVGFDGESFFADVSWETSEPSRGLLHYGAGAPADTVESTELASRSQVRAAGLDPGTIYVFAVEAVDRLGNHTVDDNGGAYYPLVVDVQDTSSLAIRLGGAPLAGAWTRVTVLPLDGMAAVDLGVVQLPASGLRWLNLPVGEALRLEVLVVIVGQPFVGTLTTPVIVPPAAVVLELDELHLEMTAGGRALAGAEVQLHTGCSAQGEPAVTDDFGVVQMLAPSGTPLRLEVKAQGTFWTPEVYSAPGAYTVDVLATLPNVVGQVRRATRPVPGMQLLVLDPAAGAARFPGESVVTDAAGEGWFWLCPGSAFELQAELFPHDVRSSAPAAPEFGTRPMNVVLELDRLRITGSEPSGGAIDARQPSSGAAGLPAGWDQVELVLGGTATGRLPGPGDFEMAERGADGRPPAIVQVAPLAADRMRVTFDQPIEPGAWTSLSHSASRTGTRLGFLPGDVDGDATSAARDVLALIDVLNGSAARPIYGADIDRDGRIGPADVLSLIDLLEGVGGRAWRGQRLPGAGGLYWIESQGRTLRAAGPMGDSRRDVLRVDDGLSQLVALAPDAGSGRIYWAAHAPDTGLARFGASETDGTNTFLILERAGVTPFGLAVDPAGGWLIWTDTAGARIQRGALDGSIVEDLVIHDKGIAPTALAVDLRAGEMYWSAAGSIWRAGLEIPAGSTASSRTDLDIVVGTAAEDPVDLAIDPLQGLLFWADAGSGRVMRASLGGAGIVVIADFGLSHPSGVAVAPDGSAVYWTDVELDVLQRSALDGSDLNFLIVAGLDAPRMVRLLP